MSLVFFRWYCRIVLSIGVLLFPIVASNNMGYFRKPNHVLVTPKTDEVQIHGIDVSWHNGDIDWAMINKLRPKAKKIRFAFIKATEGTDMVDKKLKANWSQAKEVGIKRGAYHFYLLGRDPKLQALNFIMNVDKEDMDLPPVIDFENLNNRQFSDKRIIENILEWLEIIEKHYGMKPIIYTNTPMLNSVVRPYLPDYPIWLSDFRSDNLYHLYEKPPIIWQYSEKGKIKGINSYTDLNVFIGTEHKFGKLLQRIY
ncbi:MAG: glycoside hydrolase family 25 protein [Leadbetterella sp.]